jgi:hypothetical protein
LVVGLEYRMDILQPPNLQNLEDVPVGVSRDVILRNTKTTLIRIIIEFE